MRVCVCVCDSIDYEKSTSLSNAYFVIIGLRLVGTRTFFYCIRQHIIIDTKYLHPYYRFKLYNRIYLFLRLLFIRTVRDDRVALLARPRTEDLLPGLVVPVATSYACP